MPLKYDERVIETFVGEFDKHPSLSSNGFSFLLDGSGKLFKSAKPSLRDIEINIQVGEVLLYLHYCF